MPLTKYCQRDGSGNKYFCTCAIIYIAVYYVIVIKKCDGLRERKRLETRHALEAAAIELVSANGLDATTIEAISERAGVSPRTFFNYFDSKEDALLGLHNVEFTDETVDECAERYSHSSIGESTVGLLVELVGPMLADRTLLTTRRGLIKQHPLLLERQMNRMTYVNKRIISAMQRMAAVKEVELLDGDAEVLLAVCTSSLRVAIRTWVATNKPVSLPKLEKEAIQNLQRVTNSI